MGQHCFLDTSTIEKCVSHDQRKLQLVKKTCEENVESAIDVFLEEASSVNSWQKLYQRNHRHHNHYLINYHCQFRSKPPHRQKKLKRSQSQQQQQQNNIETKTSTVSHQTQQQLPITEIPN